jgi:hypothetical protein
VGELRLHLLRSALVHVNTLLMQEALADPKWADKLTDADRRALSSLFWTHVNPYGRFVRHEQPFRPGPVPPGHDARPAAPHHWASWLAWCVGTFLGD